MFVSLGSAAENIEAAVDYLREKRECQGWFDSPERVPALPGGRRGQRAVRQAQRDRSGAHRRTHGGRQPNGARHPDGAEQGAGDAGSCGGSEPSGHHSGSDAAAVCRHLRIGFARFPARARSGRLRIRDRNAHTQGRQGRRGRRFLFRPGRGSSLRSEIGRDAVAAA